MNSIKLDGRTKRRNEIIVNWQENEVKVFQNGMQQGRGENVGYKAQIEWID